MRRAVRRLTREARARPAGGAAELRPVALMLWLCALAGAPAVAQDGRTLDDLIPREAVENPEEWAAQGASPDQPQAEPSARATPGSGSGAEGDPLSAAGSLPEPIDPETGLAADTGMFDMPLVTIPWPGDVELAEVPRIEDEEEIDFIRFENIIPVLPQGSAEIVSDELVLFFPSEYSLFPEREEFVRRFEALSSVERYEDDDNIARLAAQGREDQRLLERMLRVYGYYDAQVIRSVAGRAAISGAPGASGNREAAIRFDIIPGAQYSVGSLDLGALDETGADFATLRGAFGIVPGDRLLMDRIEAERISLDIALGEGGYPFARIEDPAILVDHRRQAGDLTMPVTPAGQYRFGQVVSDQPEFLSGRHLARMARFEPGDLYQRSDVLDLRQAVLATGLVGSVSVTPVERTAPTPGQPGTVDMEVSLTEAPLRTLAGSIGYGSQEGVRIEASWEHRNLFPPEGSLRVRGIVGTQEQLLGVTFRKNNFTGRDRIATLDAFVSTLDYTAYDARTVSLVGTFERVSTLLFQKPLSWSGGLELVATGEREADAEGNFGPRQTFFIAALPLFAQIDTSDELLDPHEGYRLAGRLSPELSRTSETRSFYLRSQADASFYRQASESVVLAGRVRFASIPGAPIDAIAPSRRLYAGGGGSVRGYGYREIGPRNSDGDPAGGRSLAEASIEARIRTSLFDGALGLVPFADAGSVGVDPLPGFEEIKFGAGIGIRYHTSFGPIRVDVAAPLNPGPNDAPVAVYVALGQAF